MIPLPLLKSAPTDLYTEIKRGNQMLQILRISQYTYMKSTKILRKSEDFTTEY